MIPHEDLPFLIEDWADDSHREVLARAAVFMVAEAAYQAACRQRPKAHMTLRLGARVIKKQNAD